MASSAIGGLTIYTYARLGTGKGSKEQLLKRVSQHNETVSRIRKTKLLIIDEISMLSGDILDKIDYIVSNIRQCTKKAFGGMQLVFCGDFFQLPPVWNQKEKENKNESKLFAFESNTWKKCNFTKIELKHIFRQTDNSFQKILNEIRQGILSKNGLSMFESRLNAKFDTNDGIIPTILLTHKKKVQEINEKYLSQLPNTNPMFEYQCKDSYIDQQYKYMLEQCCTNVPSLLKLKIGAQVTLLKNLNVAEGLCNGSRGVVTGFTAYNNSKNGNRNNGNSNSNSNNRQKNRRARFEYPIVRFTNGKEIIITHQTWTFKSGNSIVATRKQIPLDLGWALSIHKSQGMTLDRVQVSLAKVFECGQAYVAVSRAKSLDGLSIIDFDPKRIKAHPKVIKFYQNMSVECSPQPQKQQPQQPQQHQQQREQQSNEKEIKIDPYIVNQDSATQKVDKKNIDVASGNCNKTKDVDGNASKTNGNKGTDNKSQDEIPTIDVFATVSNTGATTIPTIDVTQYKV